MKIFIIILLLFFGCTAEKKITDQEISKPDISVQQLVIEKEPEKEVEKEPEKEEISVNIGWSDEDTYTVMVISSNLDRAMDAARHKILQDIVRVRMLNDSRFTDISKISEEFKDPLKQGKVLNQRTVPGGVEIYFQIKDQGLKKKFERK